MKQQRRHELQTNELADHLGQYLQGVQPYTSHIAIGVASVVILLLLLVWWGNSTSSSQGASWADYFEAAASRDAGALDEVAKLHTGTPAALWAHLSAGDVQFAEGAGLMFRDRDEAKDALEKAEEHYLAAVEAGASKYPWLMQRAQFGLGQVNESLSEVETALDHYGKAAALDPGSAVGKAATQRKDLLSEDSNARWYNWFARQEPPVPGDEPGMGGLGPNLPEDIESLPDRPDLSFPGSDLSTSSLDDTPGEAPPADAPADTDDDSTEPESTPSEPESTPSEPESTPSEPESTPSEPELTPPETESPPPAGPDADATAPADPSSTEDPAPVEENN